MVPVIFFLDKALPSAVQAMQTRLVVTWTACNCDDSLTELEVGGRRQDELTYLLVTLIFA